MTETLDPKVIIMDVVGRPVSQHETVEPKRQEVDQIRWRNWAESEANRSHKQTANMLLGLAMAQAHDHVINPIPKCLVRTGSVIQALATKDIKLGS